VPFEQRVASAFNPPDFQNSLYQKLHDTSPLKRPKF